MTGMVEEVDARYRIVSGRLDAAECIADAVERLHRQRMSTEHREGVIMAQRVIDARIAEERISHRKAREEADEPRPLPEVDVLRAVLRDLTIPQSEGGLIQPGSYSAAGVIELVRNAAQGRGVTL